jgi:hypothetical protein
MKEIQDGYKYKELNLIQRTEIVQSNQSNSIIHTIPVTIFRSRQDEIAFSSLME